MRYYTVFACVLCLASIRRAAGEFQISDRNSSADIYVDSHDAKVVQLTSDLLADDEQRVGAVRPSVMNDATKLGTSAILIGTIGQSAVIDQLISSGKLDVAGVKDQWESYVRAVVENPLPGVKQALVIAGSDRRGTAYGVMDISQQIGVSPWYWWADVTPQKRERLAVSSDGVAMGSPKVKYRGIFLNDEDFGLRPWASKTFDPQSNNLGPKTYARIFELMLRLKMNYIWPAMHKGSLEFSTFPGNSQTADDWAIVTGSSHCEPMLRNNIYWPKSSGQWRYDVNRDAIFNWWKEGAETHGNFESVWTLGIRGIHDSAMEGPKELPARVKMVEHTFADERSLIDQYVSKKFGPIAQCFVPYKEVLPLYDSGMKVPDDVTLIWPDDNYGYVRRLGTPAERLRSGGSGVYYHLSYWGAPHSYLWVESTSPGLMWEELRKTYDNDSRSIWIVNVGDLKPAEVCIDFFAKLAWNPLAWGPDAQAKFLQQFDAENFGSAAQNVEQLQADYYRLATIRKPEHIDYPWADSLSLTQLSQMQRQYQSLLKEAQEVAKLVPPDRADAYFETVGYAAQMLSATGLLYLGDEEQAKKWKQLINEQTTAYNTTIASGKWNRMMSSTMEGLSWPAAVGGTQKPAARTPSRPEDQHTVLVDAANYLKNQAGVTASWQSVSGLGWSARALTILPAVPESQWDADHLASAPTLVYPFEITTAGENTIKVHALPTMRLTAGGKLRTAYSIDDCLPKVIDVPGGESVDELGKARRVGVITNRVTMPIETGSLAAGHHQLRLFAIDPGVVLDQIEFPAK